MLDAVTLTHGPRTRPHTVPVQKVRPVPTLCRVRPPRAAPRHGFGLARARNAGARAALHDILVFLDGDVIAEARLLAARARWHHAVSDALTLGFCSRCDRGQQYCGAHCNGLARRESLRAAGRRYQQSRRGRHCHAGVEPGSGGYRERIDALINVRIYP